MLFEGVDSSRSPSSGLAHSLQRAVSRHGRAGHVASAAAAQLCLGGGVRVFQ